MNKKLLLTLAIIPVALFGCKKKDKRIYAKSTNTIYNYSVDNDEVIITGLGERYTNQTDIIIPYSIDNKIVKKIDKNAFDGVYRIESVDMSKSNVESIGEYAFKGCTNLKDIKFCETLNTLSTGTFMNCTSLTSLSLKELDITELNESVFEGCSSLTNITIPDSTLYVYTNAFKNCNSLETLDFSSTCLVGLKDEALTGLEKLSNLSFPTTFETIGKKALSGNQKLINIDLANTDLKSIGDEAFAKCENLKTVKLPESVMSIGSQAFYKCKKIEKIDLSKTLVSVIPAGCFKECSNLETVNLPDVTSILDEAFVQSGIKKITLPSTLENISNDALIKCKNLTSITCKNNNKYYDDNGVLYSSKTNTLLFYPAAKDSNEYRVLDVDNINAYAFYGATNLKKVDLSNTFIKVINEQTFAYCDKLEEIILPPDVETIKIKAFFNCTSLKGFEANSELKTIELDAFNGCSSIEVINLNSIKLETIAETAFQGCKLINELYLHKNIVTIGRNAFSDCTFNSVYFNGLKEEYLNVVKDSGLPTSDKIVNTNDPKE